MDVDRSNAEEPAKSLIQTKVDIRRLVESENIPYTYVVSNLFAGYFLPSLSHPGSPPSPPRDSVIILGDGTTKGTRIL